MSSANSASCPSCGAVDPFQYVAEIFATACSHCGHIDDSISFYQSGDHAADNYDQPTAPVSANVLGGGDVSHGYSAIADRTATAASNSMFRHLAAGGTRLLRPELTRDESRQLAARQHRPGISRLIRGALTRLGHPNFADCANALFDQAKLAAQQRHDAAALAREATATAASEAGAEADEQVDDSMASSAQRRVNFFDSPIRWGTASECMAAACCYAVLRRERRIVDLADVAEAALQPFARVQRSLRHLKFLAGENLRDVGFRHVDSHIVRMVAFFEGEMRRNGGKTLRASVRKFLDAFELQQQRQQGGAAASSVGRRTKMSTAKRSTQRGAASSSKHPSFADVRKLALDLGNLWWDRRPPGVASVHAAFAVVVLALEAVAKRAMTLDMILPYASAAASGEVRDGVEPHVDGDDGADLEDGGRHAAIVARYHELLSMLDNWASQLPWLVLPRTARATTPKRGSKLRSPAKAASAAATAPSDRCRADRNELIHHAADIVSIVTDGRVRLEEGQGLTRESQLSGDERSSDGDLPKVADSEVYLHIDLPQETFQFAGTSDGGDLANEDPLQPLLGTHEGEPASGSPLATHLLSTAGDGRLDTARARLANLESLMQTIEQLEGCGDDGDRSIGKGPIPAKADGGCDATPSRWTDIRAAVDSAHGDGEAGHPIDLLSDEQVDALLFTSSELASIFRTDEEVEMVTQVHRRLGDWDGVAAPRPARRAVIDGASCASNKQAGKIRRTKAKGLFTATGQSAAAPAQRERKRPKTSPPHQTSSSSGSSSSRRSEGTGQGRWRAEGGEVVVEEGEEEEEDNDEVATSGSMSSVVADVGRPKRKRTSMVMVGPIDLSQQEEGGSNWGEDGDGERDDAEDDDDTHDVEWPASATR